MRHSNRPKAVIPARFRDEKSDGVGKQTVAKHSKTGDLRAKLDKNKKKKDKSVSKCANEDKDNNGDSEANFSPDYETDVMEVESDNRDSGSEGILDLNNNAQRLKSVVVEASTSKGPTAVNSVRQRIAFDEMSGTKDGEILSSDNVDEQTSRSFNEFFQ